MRELPLKPRQPEQEAIGAAGTTTGGSLRLISWRIDQEKPLDFQRPFCCCPRHIAQGFNVKRAAHERVVERIRRLRERFGPGVNAYDVDDDFENLTSALPKHVPNRTFFLGEIWWADRFALGEHRPHSERSSHRPALVTLRESRPFEPVEMAPSAHRAPEEIAEFCFCATEPVAALNEETWFLVPYRRPISRGWIGWPMGSISSKDKQGLAKLLALLKQ
jgi:hypothetical protein